MIFTWFDVFVVDFNVLVTIRSALLVPSAESVEDLVYHNTLESAALIDGDVLRAANPADVRITPAKKITQTRDINFNSKI